MFWYEILIIVYFVTHFLSIPLFAFIEDKGFTWISPKNLYHYIKVNWFGAIFLWLLHLVVTPIYALIGLFIWLCTVGRER